MRKSFLLCILMALTACDEAYDVFGYEDYDLGAYGAIHVMENGYEQQYDGPVYLNATSWGSIAYVSDTYVNKGVKLFISESDNAEAGLELDITSSSIIVGDLNPGVRYFYCLTIPGSGIKSEIKSVVVPDVSSLSLRLESEDDKMTCSIEEDINEVFIVEKGFRWESENGWNKYVAEGSDFSFPLKEMVTKYGLTGNLHIYAYIQTSNAYYRSDDTYIGISEYDEQGNCNTEHITFSDFTQETIDGVDYLKCVVTGYVDSAYFYKDYSNVDNILYPDKTEVSEDGKTTAFYLKLGFYENIRLYAHYRLNNWNETASSASFTPTHFNIRSVEEFLDFVVWNSNGYYRDETVVSLLTDITVPANTRLSIRLSELTIEGNGHTLDGVSCFPLFQFYSSSSIKNLKIGTDATVYEVKKGSYSLSTQDEDPPRYLLTHQTGCRFENCEIRGTIRVSGRTDFSLMPYYEPNESTVVGDGYVEIVSGLKDYTKTEFVTNTKP